MPVPAHPPCQIHISLFFLHHSTSTVSLYSLISEITPMSPLKTPIPLSTVRPNLVPFPFQLIIILYLHHFVSFTEQPSVNLPFRLFSSAGFRVFLKDHIHSFFSRKTFFLSVSSPGSHWDDACTYCGSFLRINAMIPL